MAYLPISQLHTILDFQNTEANKFSNQSMVVMTKEMNEIASQTKIETVSMRVITLVTLFFLPGTFISVGRRFLLVSSRLRVFNGVVPISYERQLTSLLEDCEADILAMTDSNEHRNI